MTADIDELEDLLVDLIDVETRSLVIFNDDHNTFDHVINTLVKVCKHTVEQAEQCAWIIHTKGKYCVKKGSYEKLKAMRDAICEAGIDAKII